MSSSEQIGSAAELEQQPAPGRSRLLLWGLGILALALIVIATVSRIQRHSRATETAQTASASLPDVSVVKVRLTSGTSELELPGNLEAINVASIYARTNGYLRQRFVDIGTRVKTGQILAVIDTPEVDQELAQGRAALEQSRAALEQANANLQQAEAQVTQAKANIAQAKANEEIAATTNQRWTRLVNRGVLPRQDGDERRSAYDARVAESQAAVAALATAEASVVSKTADISAAKATVAAQAANVRRLEEMQAFKRVLAPFDGVVTERHVEKGDLVYSGSSTDKNLFSVSQANVLRIQVSVPQTFAVDVEKGQNANVTVRERPGEVFKGQVARTADSITSATRTLLTEVQVANASGRLLPGMYGEVNFVLPRSHPVVLIPGSALIANSQGTRVVQIRADHRAHFLVVTLGRDLGKDLEVVSGLNGSETVVTNPPDTLAEGQEVNVASEPADGKANAGEKS